MWFSIGNMCRMCCFCSAVILKILRETFFFFGRSFYKNTLKISPFAVSCRLVSHGFTLHTITEHSQLQQLNTLSLLFSTF